MISLNSILDDIKDDFKKPQYVNSVVLSRRFVLARENIITVALNKNTMLCEVAVEIPNDISLDELNSLPKWKGMEEKSTMVPDGGKTSRYLAFKQLDGYDSSIFVKVMQDVCDEVDQVVMEKCVPTIKATLQKWSTFFQFERDYVLSSNAQQGLYGELWFLEKMILKYGEKALSGWTGYNSESHDFYYGKDAIEVKTSSAKGPEKVRISNEYQLEDSGVSGILYLLYINMKKSEVDGEGLPVIINRIMNLLDDTQKHTFKENLFKVGYVYIMPELYKYHFKVREESFFRVKDSFPRITSKTISKGIGAVEYVLSLDACRSYMIETEAFFKGVDYQ